MQYLLAFVVGGLFCAIGEILILKTKLTPARILVGYVVSGVVLSALGLYGTLVDIAGAGATVPLTGFGHLLAQGVREAVDKNGLFGAITGGLEACAGGIGSVIFFALFTSLFFQSKPERKHKTPKISIYKR